MLHNTFHSVCNQTETFPSRCTPTDNDKQSLKLDSCSSISCDFTIDFGAVYFLSLYFCSFLWLDSLSILTVNDLEVCGYCHFGRMFTCLYACVCVCVSEESASSFNSRWHFLLLLFFVCKILYIGIAFQIKRRYSFDTSMHIKSYPIKLKNHLLIPTERGIQYEFELANFCVEQWRNKYEWQPEN